MKKIFLLLFLAVTASQAGLSLINCKFEFNMDLGKSLYVGTYRSLSGNIYQYYFDSYCPSYFNP